MLAAWDDALADPIRTLLPLFTPPPQHITTPKNAKTLGRFSGRKQKHGVPSACLGTSPSVQENRPQVKPEAPAEKVLEPMGCGAGRSIQKWWFYGT